MGSPEEEVKMSAPVEAPVPAETPPAAHYAQPMGSASGAVAPTALILTEPILLGEPTPCICPHCRADVISEVKYVNGLYSKIFGFFAGMATIICCCTGALIPMKVLKFTRDVEHSCPKCRAFLGKVKRM